MTHLEVVMHELSQHGRTTYADLMATYGPRGYTMRGFCVAVHRARRTGAIAPMQPGLRSHPIVAVGACPSCGRALPRRSKETHHV